MMMADQMRAGWARINEILGKWKVDEEVYETVRNEYQYMCYLWAESVACGKVVEEKFKALNEDAFNEAVNPARNFDRITKQIWDLMPKEWTMCYGEADEPSGDDQGDAGAGMPV